MKGPGGTSDPSGEAIDPTAAVPDEDEEAADLEEEVSARDALISWVEGTVARIESPPAKELAWCPNGGIARKPLTASVRCTGNMSNAWPKEACPPGGLTTGTGMLRTFSARKASLVVDGGTGATDSSWVYSETWVTRLPGGYSSAGNCGALTG